MDGLLHLVQRMGTGLGRSLPRSLGPPRCTKCNSPPINCQCTNNRIAVYNGPLLWGFIVPVKVLNQFTHLPSLVFTRRPMVALKPYAQRVGDRPFIWIDLNGRRASPYGVFSLLHPRHLHLRWDVMLVWRKGNINRTVYVSPTVLSTIIMVDNTTSSSYRLVDWIELWSCLV